MQYGMHTGCFGLLGHGVAAAFEIGVDFGAGLGSSDNLHSSVLAATTSTCSAVETSYMYNDRRYEQYCSFHA